MMAKRKIRVGTSLCSAVGKTWLLDPSQVFLASKAKDLEGLQGFKAAHSGKGDQAYGWPEGQR